MLINQQLTTDVDQQKQLKRLDSTYSTESNYSIDLEV
jgi:hypothetical protein